MNIIKINKLLIVGITTLLWASCSSLQNTIREPEALIKYDKSEFDYSDQVLGKATTVKILGVDWSRLFDSKSGLVETSSSVFGMSPKNKSEEYALYNLMNANTGYDIIVYPQYTKTKKASGVGLFYSKTVVEAKARLAVINDFYATEGEKSSPKTAELETSLATLQGAYDDLVGEVSGIKEECASKEAEMQKQINDAKAKAAKALIQTQNTVAVSEQQATKAPSTTPPLSSTTPPLSSTKTTSRNTLQAHSVLKTYSLIIGSYSTLENAEHAVANFNKAYPALKGQVGIVTSGKKCRIGFVNLKTRDNADAYKANLIKNYPEFKDAWLYKP